jgi:ech hydrogenase subunit A
MSGLLLAALLVIIPAVGALIGLLLSQLEDSVAFEGKTRDWLLFIFIFLPTAIISIVLLTHLRSGSSFSITWLPGIEIGLHLSRPSIIFACVIANFSALIALYSISFMSFDRYRTQYWFFYQLTIAAMMMGIFSNNLFWLFGGFEVASIGAFFLISHWHRKSGEEGQKAGTAAIRYLIISICGDIFLLIGFGLILVAFNTSLIGELFNKWVAEPVNIIGKSSTATRTIITFFIVFGALIKSAQIPILLWPLSGKSKDYDLAKSPITVAAFLVAITAGNIGLFILSVFQPIFSSTLTEVGTGVPIFSSMR